MQMGNFLLRTAARIVLLMLSPWAAMADDAALRRCRVQTDSTQRLACYDAIAMTPTTATPASPVAAEAARQFGLEANVRRVELDVIESRIEGRFNGWNANDQIALANGQIWQVSDGSLGVFSAINPKVSVRRGTFGTYFMEIEGINRSPKVKRVK